MAKATPKQKCKRVEPEYCITPKGELAVELMPMFPGMSIERMCEVIAVWEAEYGKVTADTLHKWRAARGVLVTPKEAPRG